MRIYCFDLDGTICTQEPDNSIPYNEAQPIREVIDKINKLYDEGNWIIIFTARGSATGIDWTFPTVQQLHDWKVKYHELKFGKPQADFYIDDRAINVKDF